MCAKRESGSGVLGSSFYGMDSLGFLYDSWDIGIDLYYSYIWGFAGGGLISTLSSSARLS